VKISIKHIGDSFIMTYFLQFPYDILVTVSLLHVFDTFNMTYC